MLTLESLNKIFNNIPRNLQFVKKISDNTSKFEDGGLQGEVGEIIKIYSSSELPEDVFIKITYVTDSYGGNEAIDSICFVKEVEKTVTVYE